MEEKKENGKRKRQEEDNGQKGPKKGQDKENVGAWALVLRLLKTAPLSVFLCSQSLCTHWE